MLKSEDAKRAGANPATVTRATPSNRHQSENTPATVTRAIASNRYQSENRHKSGVIFENQYGD